MADFKGFCSCTVWCGLSHSTVHSSGSGSCLPSKSRDLGWTASAKPLSLCPCPCGFGQAAGWRRWHSSVTPGLAVCGDHPSSRESPSSSITQLCPAWGTPWDPKPMTDWQQQCPSLQEGSSPPQSQELTWQEGEHGFCHQAEGLRELGNVGHPSGSQCAHTQTSSYFYRPFSTHCGHYF